MNKAFSVVIPVFNQFERLNIVLHHFSKAKLIDEFEIIIVDDGSSDKLSECTSQYMKTQYDIANIEIMHQANKGRSSARNLGVMSSQGNYIIFCDGDRIPNKNMLKDYRDLVMKHKIIIGGSLDCFMPIEQLYYAADGEIERMSRYGGYYKQVCECIFRENKATKSEWSWLGFLVGNSCVKKDIILDVGGFSEEFKDWGFEHFEMAYRMIKAGYSLWNNKNIKNYHIVHKRNEQFYQKQITKSIDLLCSKYDISKEKLLRLFLSTNINEKYNFDLLDSEEVN